MEQHQKQTGTDKPQSSPANSDKQGIDKAPGEEQGKQEQVTNEDLKGKAVDRDTDKESDKPLSQP